MATIVQSRRSQSIPIGSGFHIQARIPYSVVRDSYYRARALPRSGLGRGVDDVNVVKQVDYNEWNVTT